MTIVLFQHINLLFNFYNQQISMSNKKQNTHTKSKQETSLVSILKKPSTPKEGEKTKKKNHKIVSEMEDASDNDAVLFEQQPQPEVEAQNSKEAEIMEQKKRLQKLLEQIQKQKHQRLTNPQTKQKKKRTITINQNLNTEYDLDKKWDTVIQNEKKGPFSQEEEQILYKSICNYAIDNDLTIEDIQQQILYNVNPNKKKAMWTTICSVLPRRSINSCFKYLKRKLDPKNYHGHWTPEEVEELKAAVDQHHTKWTTIAKILNRTPQNIRDKYRSLGEERSQERNISFWKMAELIAFLKTIQKQIQVKFLSKDFKNKVKDHELHDNYQLKEREGRKRISQNFLFHNLSVLINFINFGKLQNVDVSGISWVKVSQAVGTKSKDDCRNKWKQIYNIVLSKKDNFTQQQDKILINSLEEQDLENQFEVNFEVENNHSASSNKARWNILKKFASGRISKSIKDIIKQIKSKNFKNDQTLPDTEEIRILKMFTQMKKVQQQAAQ